MKNHGESGCVWLN